MQLDRRAISSLIQALVLTQDNELDCDGCSELLAEFTEKALLGQTIPAALELVAQHLKLCPDCREEFELLSNTLVELDSDFKNIA